MDVHADKANGFGYQGKEEKERHKGKSHRGHSRSWVLNGRGTMASFLCYVLGDFGVTNEERAN